MKTISSRKAKYNLAEVFTVHYGDSVLVQNDGRRRDVMIFNAEDAKVMILCSYVNGALKRHIAMRMLGFEWYGQLLDALIEKGFERPSLPEKQLDEMVAKAVAMLKEVGAV